MNFNDFPEYQPGAKPGQQQADGIDPTQITDAEREQYAAMNAIPDAPALDSAPEWHADMMIPPEQWAEIAAEAESRGLEQDEDGHWFDAPQEPKRKIVQDDKGHTVTVDETDEREAITDHEWAAKVDAFTERMTQRGEEIARPATHLIHSLIPAQSTGIMFAPSGTYKTFVALGLCQCVAAGVPFNGLAVRHAGVYYAAVEDAAGAYQRAEAWKEQRGHGLDHFVVDNQPIPLWDNNACYLLGRALRDAWIRNMGVPLGLIVIDTLSTNMGGAVIGDQPFSENSNDQVAVVLKNAETLARESGGTVLIVAHSGKDTTKGTRGASAWRANVGFQLLLTRGKKPGQVTIHHDKAKNGQQLPPRVFKLDKIPLPPRFIKAEEDALQGMIQPTQTTANGWDMGGSKSTLQLDPIAVGSPKQDDADEEDQKPQPGGRYASLPAELVSRGKLNNAGKLWAFMRAHKEDPRFEGNRYPRAMLKTAIDSDDEFYRVPGGSFNAAVESLIGLGLAVVQSEGAKSYLTLAKDYAKGKLTMHPLPTDWKAPDHAQQSTGSDGEILIDF